MNRREAKRMACRLALAAIISTLESGRLLENMDYDYPDVDVDRIERAINELVDELMRRGGVEGSDE